MKERKKYLVTIEVSSVEEIVVTATSKVEARKKALTKLDRKKASSYIHRSYPNNKLQIDVEVEL